MATKERYEELNSTAHGLLVEEVKEQQSGLDFDKLTKAELISYAKGKGIELNQRMTREQILKELI